MILALDTLYVGPAVDAELRAFLRDEHGVRDADVLLLASHTHYAPALDATKPLLGVVDAGYVAFVLEECKRMLRRLLARPTVPLSLSPASLPWRGAIGRRRSWRLPYVGGTPGHFGLHGPAMAPARAELDDHRVRSWLMRSTDGAPLAVLWSCACHPTGFPRPGQVSAEFPGRVREAVRTRIDPALPVVFLPGFAGDVRQRSPETRPVLRRALRTARWGPSFCPLDETGWRCWIDELTATVEATLGAAEQALPAPLSGSLRSASGDLALAEVLDGTNDPRSIRFQRLRIGDALDLWAVAAEPSLALRELLPRAGSTVAVGYLGDVFGYWPTARQAAEGGYEGHDFITAFGLSGRLRPSIDDAFRSMVERLDGLDDV